MYWEDLFIYNPYYYLGIINTTKYLYIINHRYTKQAIN